MEHIAPLIQTVLWVGLVVWLVQRYHSPLLGVLTALQKRVESGGTVKLGPVELMEQLRTQEPAEQREKIAAEVAETLPAPLAAGHVSVTVVSDEPNQLSEEPASPDVVILAEDLAVRAIQAEYGQPINRQVVLGRVRLDGAFVANGKFNVVEVKYVRDARSLSRLEKSLVAMSNAIDTLHWRNVHIILAVVFEREEDIGAASDVPLLDVGRNLPFSVTVRPFALAELRKRFGIDSPASH